MSGLLKPLFYESLKHIYRLIFDSEYRYYCWLVSRYGNTKRFCRRNIRIHGWNIVVPDVASFLSAYREIFVEEIYAFTPDGQFPAILDCGANIGLSVLYFKKKYPQTKVVAYEADPKMCTVLKQNIYSNKITDVEIINKAVWSTETFVEFSVEGADGGRIETGSNKNVITVPAVSLSSILKQQKFDFVKIDIEGAEVEALKDCDTVLAQLRYVFIEFHSFCNRKQELGKLIYTFERNGFRVHIHPPFIVKRPFMGIQGRYGMDMQLNLFFWKPDNEQA